MLNLLTFKILNLWKKNKKKGSNDKKDKDKKKKSGEGQKKINEQNLKQKSWLAFASGSAMAPGRKTTKTKRLVQPPINKRSIFATPENPEGKVGVVGSGKPMTQFQQRDQCENIMKYIEVGWYYYYYRAVRTFCLLFYFIHLLRTYDLYKFASFNIFYP